MNKAQTAAVLALGAILGAGGKGLVDFAASAASPGLYTHAADLRRSPKPDGGTNLRVEAYAIETTADGGRKDRSRASKCTPSAPVVNEFIAGMDALAKECSWER